MEDANVKASRRAQVPSCNTSKSNPKKRPRKPLPNKNNPPNNKTRKKYFGCSAATCASSNFSVLCTIPLSFIVLW